MEATTSKEGGLNERGPKAIVHEMGLQVSHGVHSEVGGIQCGGIHQGEECNLDCPELSGTETPFDREEFLSARLFRFHGGDGQTIRAGIHLAAGAGGAAFGGAEHGVGASAAFRRLLTGPFEGLTEISPRLCRGSFNSANKRRTDQPDGSRFHSAELRIREKGRAGSLSGPAGRYCFTGCRRAPRWSSGHKPKRGSYRNSPLPGRRAG